MQLKINFFHHLITCFLLSVCCGFACADDGYYWPLSSGVYPQATGLASADFNGDSNADLVMIYGVEDGVISPVAPPTFFLQTSAGIFNMVSHGNPVVGSRVAAADFNNDSNIDLVITGGDTSDSLVFPSSTAVYFNSGDWSANTGFDFDAPLVLGQLQYAPELAVGDYDDDGDVDIILGVSEPGGFGSIVIWVNQGFAQAGTVGTFQPINYIEDSGPYNEITALSLGQVSTTNNTLDLMFARSNSNKVKIALNNNVNGFSTNTDDVAVSGVIVNDIQMVADDYMAVANSGAPSMVYQIARNVSGMPTNYNMFRLIGTDIQASEKIIPMSLNSQPAFFLSSDFAGDSNAGVTSLALYGFVIFGANTQLGVVPQCLLSNVAPAQSALNLEGNGSGDEDLMLLTQEGVLYQLFNDASPSLLQCCMTESQFIAVTEPVVPAPIIQNEPHQNQSETNHKPAGLSQTDIWLDSFSKLVTIRKVLMSLSADAQRYVNNYEQHETQLLQLLASDPQIASAWGQVITSWNEPITALLEGSDDQYTLAGLQMNDLSTFLTLLQNEPGVGTTVSNELALIQPLMSYVGRTMQDFTADTIAVSSPIIFNNGFE